ncbi:MAG: glycosyltransferase [Phycisphaerales bacterium]|nr:glycosyltransferase [Phycisphaerales bacterium]
MRIALCVWQFPVLSETFVLNQITWLLDRGHDVQIFPKRWMRPPHHADVDRYRLLDRCHFRARRAGGTYGPPGARRGPGVAAVLRAPARAARLMNPVAHGASALSLKLLTAAAPFQGQAPFDAALCHFGPAAATAARLRACGVFDAPILAFFHGGDLLDTPAADKRFLFNAAERIAAVSERMRQQLVGMGSPPQRTVVHKMGVDLRALPFRDRGAAFAEPLRMISVARLVPIKGLEWALRAVAALAPGERARLCYTVVGGGPLEGPLRALASSLGLTGVVRFTGPLPHDRVREELDRSHLFLFPSTTMPDGRQEAMGVAAMEALACGIPVIASRTGGIPELVVDGVCGVLVNDRDPLGIAAAIRAVLADPSMLSRLGAGGRSHVVAHHDLDTQNTRLEAMLAGLAAEAAR